MTSTFDGSKKNQQVERLLLNIIMVLHDGQKGFAESGEHLKNDLLKRYFLAESLKRASFRVELENELHHIGMADVSESGSVFGTMHRIWGDPNTRLGGGDLALLEIAELGEDVAHEVYASALEKPLPAPIRQLQLEQQAHNQPSLLCAGLS